ncbi:HEPN domain-containing protein [Pseudomonas siliginis]|uniref:HEPN domain-containing protein n=1 Tax=Pseudomonas siliginis TaxID=2842346 RepID=A0ABY5C8C7_9PSED|nr:HEPN domain-containing protein [Pseudomonas siliginis]UST83348.1 HEPN domain-containing protein [Pseudomonas siliginis]
MSNYRVEYLSVISSKEDFCKTVESFNNLLQSYGSIKVVADKIEYDGVAFGYSVQFGEINGGEQLFFHLKFFCSNKKNIEKFKALLRSVRTLLARVGDRPAEVLWDDISSELSTAAYPVIYELENLMRKLITKFMLISIGVSWVKSVVPKEVSESLRGKKGIAQNYLHDTDFIQLSNFLFRKYATGDSETLIVKISKAGSIEELVLSELKEMVPLSNWERYFSPIVDCSSEYLKIRWDKLYELRCIVAHNNFLSQEQFAEIGVLSSEIKTKLTTAIENIDQVHVSEEQRSEVVDSVVDSIGTYNAEFLKAWIPLVKDFHRLFNITAAKYGRLNESPDSALRNVAKTLLIDNVIGVELFEKLDKLGKRRNEIVDGSGEALTSEELISLVSNIKEMRVSVNSLILLFSYALGTKSVPVE